MTDHQKEKKEENRQQTQEQPAKGKEQSPGKKQEGGLKKEDLPDSTNESKGTTGSGQRQDSN